MVKEEEEEEDTEDVNVEDDDNNNNKVLNSVISAHIMIVKLRISTLMKSFMQTLASTPRESHIFASEVNITPEKIVPTTTA